MIPVAGDGDVRAFVVLASMELYRHDKAAKKKKRRKKKKKQSRSGFVDLDTVRTAGVSDPRILVFTVC